MNQSNYIGSELGLFEKAVNWKRYYSRRIKKFLQGKVLEIGAGYGTNTPYLFNPKVTRWLSVEPDEKLCKQYAERRANGVIPSECEIKNGTLSELEEGEKFDAIIYIDVLEHIKDDRNEFERAYKHLNEDGFLIILCPAYPFLFSPFDEAIGHYRRYTKRMFKQLSPNPPLLLEYLDTVGVLASTANKLVLKQSTPSESQIQLWDNIMIPCSLVIDSITCRAVGKSLLGVWKKRGDSNR